MNEMKMMKKEGRGMAKADMQKVAGKAVKGHESRMHGAKKMAAGGRAMPAQANMGMRGLDRAAAMSGRVMPATGRPMGMKKGGSVDGAAHKGKTKGTMIKMAKGGMTKKGGRGC
jgi:hypothetical protein